VKPRTGGTLDQAVDSQAQAIDRLSGWVQAKGLGPVAILFLEMGKPLSLIASQALLFLQPVLGYVGPMFGLFDDQGLLDDEGIIAKYAALFEDPANIDRILARLEEDVAG
jgi:hypothetical protein